MSSREALSDAAFWGDWEKFWTALNIGSEEYAESWINAIRLSESFVWVSRDVWVVLISCIHIEPLELANEMSYWTPLHQAVYNHIDDHATLELVKKLIKAGAFRKHHSELSIVHHY